MKVIHVCQCLSLVFLLLFDSDTHRTYARFAIIIQIKCVGSVRAIQIRVKIYICVFQAALVLYALLKVGIIRIRIIIYIISIRRIIAQNIAISFDGVFAFESLFLIRPKAAYVIKPQTHRVIMHGTYIRIQVRDAISVSDICAFFLLFYTKFLLRLVMVDAFDLRRVGVRPAFALQFFGGAQRQGIFAADWDPFVLGRVAFRELVVGVN